MRAAKPAVSRPSAKVARQRLAHEDNLVGGQDIADHDLH